MTEEILVIPVETCPFDPDEDQRRYCEFLLYIRMVASSYAEVWGTQGLNNCPSQCLEDVDLEAVKAEYNALEISLNGPRIWLPYGKCSTSRQQILAFSEHWK
jgi:hypothetical protein